MNASSLAEMEHLLAMEVEGVETCSVDEAWSAPGVATCTSGTGVEA